MPRRPPEHEMVTSRKVPRAFGPRPHGVRVKGSAVRLYVSGQIPAKPPVGTLCTGEMRLQARQALANLRHVVLDAGFTMDEVVQIRIYVTCLDHFDRIDEEYRKIFVGQSLPARTVLQVAGLLQGVGIEVEAVAIKRDKGAPRSLSGHEDQEMSGEDMPIYGGGGSGSSIQPI